jgi:site-specific recombinase XerD
MAKLLFTTEAFRPLSTPVRGVPMLLDRHMRLVEPACSWLLHIALVRGRTRSRETWRTYAEALYDWWQTLEAMEWKWDAVTPLHLAAYRDRMLSGPSTHTQRPYSRSTINARVRMLAMFYGWCVQTRLLPRAPFLEVEMRVRGPHRDRLLAHLDVS